MWIETLGDLTVDEHIPEWLVSQALDVPYFPGVKLRFVLENLASDGRSDDFVSAATRFLGLTTRDRDLAAPYVFENYCKVREAIGEEDIDVKIAGPATIWRHVRPGQIHVARRSYGDRKVYVQITAECDWEPEHGLQIVYREGWELKRVSDQDGHLTHADAYALPEEQDRIV